MAAVSSSIVTAESRPRAPSRSASPNSAALEYRCSGRAASERLTARLNSGDTSGLIRCSGSGAPSCWRVASSVNEPVSYGSRPASNWYRTTPSE